MPRRSSLASAETDRIRDNVLSIFKPYFSVEDRADVARTLAWIHELHDRATQGGAAVLVVVVPTAPQIPGELRDPPLGWGLPAGAVLPDLPQRWITADLGARGIRYLDLLPSLLKIGPGVAFGYRDKHFSKEGHRIVGELTAKEVIRLLRERPPEG
jgi:hypothetical protein